MDDNFWGAFFGGMIGLCILAWSLVLFDKLSDNPKPDGEKVCIEAKAKGYKLEQCEGGK